MKTALIVFLITLITIIGIRNVFAGINLPPSSPSVTNNYTNNWMSGSVTMGGSLLLAGGCQSQDVTVTGATVGMGVNVNPTTDPGGGSTQYAWVNAANTVRVRVCGIIAITPASTTYQIKVMP